MEFQLALVFCGLAIANGLLTDGEACDVNVHPESSHPKVMFRLVPDGCMEGVFSWSYPERSVHLEFPNPGNRNMTVCVMNNLLGEIFTIRDITHGIGMPMVIGERESCALWHRTEVILGIDAPKVLYYVASIRYRVLLVNY